MTDRETFYRSGLNRKAPCWKRATACRPPRLIPPIWGLANPVLPREISPTIFVVSSTVWPARILASLPPKRAARRKAGHAEVRVS